MHSTQPLSLSISERWFPLCSFTNFNLSFIFFLPTNIPRCSFCLAQLRSMVENFSTDREKKVWWRSSHSNVSTCCGIETMTWGFLRGKLLCLCYKWRRKVHYTRKLFRWTLSIGLCMTGMEGHKINKNNYFLLLREIARAGILGFSLWSGACDRLSFSFSFFYYLFIDILPLSLPYDSLLSSI